MIASVLKQNWWILVLRGVLAILFGICAFIWPMVTAVALVFLFAIFAFVEGIFALAGAFGYGLAGGQRLLMILLGILGLWVGFYAFTHPGVAAVAIVFWVGWWAIIAGVIQLIVAIQMRKEIDNEWMLILGALLSLLFGVLLLWRPLPGVLTLTWLFGFYAILFGIFMLSVGMRVKSLASRLSG